MDSFLESVQSLKPGGSTALYSAMQNGIAKLETIKAKFSNVLLRMMIISDGEDNKSTITAKAVSELLIRASIVVDVFAVGGNCELVRLISKLTGGYCYYTDSILDGVRTFESETILKLSLRKKVVPLLPQLNSDEHFARLASMIQFDRDPPDMIRLSISTARLLLWRHI